MEKLKFQCKSWNWFRSSMQAKPNRLTPPRVRTQGRERRRRTIWRGDEFRALPSQSLICPGDVQQSPHVLHRCSNRPPVVRVQQLAAGRLCGACRRRSVVGPRCHFQVGTEQLLVKRREVRPDHVGVNASERRQFLWVPTAQWTQRWHFTSELRTGSDTMVSSVSLVSVATQWRVHCVIYYISACNLLQWLFGCARVCSAVVHNFSTERQRGAIFDSEFPCSINVEKKVSNNKLINVEEQFI